MSTVFDTDSQQDSLPSKIVVGLERISEVFKSLLWQHAKHIGLSPIQIQILIFVKYHKDQLCNVSHLAREFHITKATVSDAVRVLMQKELAVKKFTSSDARSYTIALSDAGEDVLIEVEQFANPIEKELTKVSNHSLANLYSDLSDLIWKLNQAGLLAEQRMCFSCRFFESKSDGTNYCNYLQQELNRTDLRMDCPEYEEPN